MITSNEISLAVATQDLEVIQAAIKTKSIAFSQEDKETGDNLLHELAASANTKIVELVLNYLKKSTCFDDMLLKQNRRGETPFHRVVVNSSAEIIQLFLNTLNETTQKITRLCNNKGKLPINLMEGNKCINDKAQQIIYDRIFSIMIAAPIKPLNATMKPDDISKFTALTSDEKLRKNILIASYLVNEVRKKIKHSDTHPVYNTYTSKNKNKTNKAVDEVRNKCKKYKKMFNGDVPFVKLTKMLIDAVQKIPYANCQEFSEIAMYLAKQIFPEIKTKIFDIKNGDHVFLIIDPDNEDQAVVCDAWAGMVYPLKEINNYLMNYEEMTHQGKTYNVLIHYNPRFHKIKAMEARDAKQATPCKEVKQEVALQFPSAVRK
jgi:hypothetical protein